MYSGGSGTEDAPEDESEYQKSLWDMLKPSKEDAQPNDGLLDLNPYDIADFFRLPSPLRTPMGLASTQLTSLTPSMRQQLAKISATTPTGIASTRGAAMDGDPSGKRQKTGPQVFRFDDFGEDDGGDVTMDPANGDSHKHPSSAASTSQGSLPESPLERLRPPPLAIDAHQK